MFTNEQLKAMIHRKTISAQYPYCEQEDERLLDYLKPLLADMTQANIRYEMESDHYGCGYASYIQLMCYTEAFVTVSEEDGGYEEDRRGLFILISRLAPVVAIVNDAWQFVRFDENGEETGSGGGAMVTDPELIIDPQYQQLADDLARLLKKYHFTMIQQEDVDKPLPFDEKIRTLARSRGDYLVWDAIFYWED